MIDGVEIDASEAVYASDLPLLLADHKQGAPWAEDAQARRADLYEFVFETCGAQPNWNTENFISDQIDLVRQQVGETGKVLLALSGGVDSSVVAALLAKAIGDRLTCVHVNHGLMRKGPGSISLMIDTTSSMHFPGLSITFMAMVSMNLNRRLALLY